ncbi:BACON domain-containing protein [Porphyromonas sp.]|uniref:BACON domain-containing protein n=1 Tax=Porphyromonas sp. TaxID=1924944 RepID=UPI0026DB4CC5|nr:BACON domain-containing protein [Porphyromonas sp.]MDO4771740.1 BACON domain-containing protein [Porphyromonas sp.]
MKLQRISGLSSLIIAMLSFTGCMEESLYEDAILKVSENPVFFAKEASEKTISIQSNRDKWEATSAQEGQWLTLTKEGNTLKIATKENTMGIDRIAIVSVHAGDISERIEVHQRASDILIESEGTDIRFATSGGTKKLRLFSNVPNLVKVEVEGADWLKADYRQGEGTFELVARDNPDLLPRNAKVILSAGQQARELNVTQEGVLDLALPLMTYPATLKDVINFERSRGNILAQTPDGFNNKTFYRFTTGNTIISNIEYEYPNMGQLVFDRSVAGVADADLMRNSDFESFMNLRGFVKGKSTSILHNYVNETNNYRARVNFPSKGGALMTLTYLPKQTQAYPTFSKLTSFDQVPLIGDYDQKEKGARKQEVLDFEANLGSKFNEQESKDAHKENPAILAFDAAKSDAPEGLRMYNFIVAGKNGIPKKDPAEGELESTLTTVLDVSRAFWQLEDNYYLTKELIDLMESKGYVYHSKTNKGVDRFYNPTSHAMMGFKVESLADYNDNKPFVLVTAYKVTIGEQNSATEDLLYKRFRETVSKK